MKKDFPFIPINYKKFEADERVKLMDLPQFGAYMRLIFSCWHTGSIPSDLKQVERLSTYRGNDFENEIWAAVRPCFTLKGDRFHQNTIDEEREKIEIKQKKLSEAGRLGYEIKVGLSHPSNNGKPSLSNQNHIQKQNHIKTQSKVSGTYSLGGFRFFNEKEEIQIRNEITKALGFQKESEANTVHYIEICEQVESAKGIKKNKVAYAIGIARGLKK